MKIEKIVSDSAYQLDAARTRAGNGLVFGSLL